MMNKQKTIIIFLICSILFLGIFNLSFASAGLNIEDLNIESSGKFIYKFEKYDEDVHMIMTITVETENKTIFTQIKDRNIKVYQADMDGDINLLEYLDSNLYLEYTEESGTLSGVLYIPKEDNISKSELAMDFQLFFKTNNVNYDITGDIVSTKELLYDDEPEDTNLGDMWTKTVKSEKKETTTMTIVGTTSSNTDVNWDNKTETKNFEYISEEKVDVPAGSFNTYVIKQTTVGESNYTLEYYDKETKILVKMVEYFGTNIPTNSEMVLMSYDISSSKSEDKDESEDKSPGFEILLIFTSIIAILVWKKTKK